MIALTLIATLLMALVSIYQFGVEAKQYNQERLDRKEDAVREHIAYKLNTTSFPLETENLPFILKNEIYELANIHNLEINIYDLKGQLLKSSKVYRIANQDSNKLPKHILNLVNNSIEKRYVDYKKINGVSYYFSYSLILDNRFKPIGILNIPYIEDEGHYEREIDRFFIDLGKVYFFMLLFAFGMAYFLSTYITQAIKSIADKINETRLNKRNEKIDIESKSKEIDELITAYNAMIDELEESAVKLAQSERENAWREMARQVAHEVKNPLTPMRLTVQSFQRKFDPTDEKIKEKLNDYTQTLLEQIDTMSAVANAFSNFATMPEQQKESLNVVSVIKRALDIFDESYISFEANADEIMLVLDRTQLIRIITNLVKNAIQAMPDSETNPSIIVSVFKSEETVTISVKDNGTGIQESNKNRVFEPKFTTKNSGMGLGLGIIKNVVESYQGQIYFNSEAGKGTEFIVILPFE
uniref:sensor histidine kinase n=1 Tax=Flavobacterium sp. TaxID=239 RepID=UPI004049798E